MNLLFLGAMLIVILIFAAKYDVSTEIKFWGTFVKVSKNENNNNKSNTNDYNEVFDLNFFMFILLNFTKMELSLRKY